MLLHKEVHCRLSPNLCNGFDPAKSCTSISVHDCEHLLARHLHKTGICMYAGLCKDELLKADGCKTRLPSSLALQWTTLRIWNEAESAGGPGAGQASANDVYGASSTCE